MRINTDKNCNIVIFDDTEYPVNELNYQDSVTLYIAQLNESSKITNLYTRLDPHSDTLSDGHRDSENKPIVLEPQKGGFLTFCHIILPKNPSNDDISYYSDGTNIYKKVQDKTIKVDDWQELVDLNNPPFIRHIQNFFSVCYLRKCYVSLCQKIFNAKGFDRCFNGKIDSSLIYKRDLVWAALNVIQYMIDSNQLAEAQRLLERINGCNGLCSSEDIGDKGCGCEK